MKEKMSKAGYTQGDMSPTVESYQKPEGDFAERVLAKQLNMSKDKIACKVACLKD